MECENTITQYRLYILLNIMSTCAKILIFIINMDNSMDLIKDITKMYGVINILMYVRIYHILKFSML